MPTPEELEQITDPVLKQFKADYNAVCPVCDETEFNEAAGICDACGYEEE